MLDGRERALAVIDLAAVAANVRRLRRDVAPSVQHCAVVKADGYGHGAVAVARAAQAAGSTWLAVATVAEAEELRAAGLQGPLLILGPLVGAELPRVAELGADAIAWSPAFVAAALARRIRLHVKYDSGMGRLGATAEAARELCAGAASAGLLAGFMSHLATADAGDPDFMNYQLDRFSDLAGELKRAQPQLVCHVANSAATLRARRSHFDLVRTGIAMYGLAPSNDDPGRDDLLPALRLTSYIADVRTLAADESVGYGRSFIAERPTRIAIVPIGYADGIRRGLSNRGEVLIGGRRCLITATVSMDQLTVALPDDCGAPGDEVVLIGAASDAPQRILCEELARHLQTINYEVVCGLSARVARRYAGAPVAGAV